MGPDGLYGSEICMVQSRHEAEGKRPRLAPERQDRLLLFKVRDPSVFDPTAPQAG